MKKKYGMHKNCYIATSEEPWTKERRLVLVLLRMRRCSSGVVNQQRESETTKRPRLFACRLTIEKAHGHAISHEMSNNTSSVKNEVYYEPEYSKKSIEAMFLNLTKDQTFPKSINNRLGIQRREKWDWFFCSDKCSTNIFFQFHFIAFSHSFGRWNSGELLCQGQLPGELNINGRSYEWRINEFFYFLSFASSSMLDFEELIHFGSKRHLRSKNIVHDCPAIRNILWTNKNKFSMFIVPRPWFKP